MINLHSKFGIFCFITFLAGTTFVQQACAVLSHTLVVENTRSIQSGILFEDSNDPHIYYAYVIDSTNTDIGPPKFSYKKINFSYKDGQFIDAASSAVNTEEAESKFSLVEDAQNQAIDQLGTHSNFIPLKQIPLTNDLSFDVHIMRDKDVNLKSQIVFHNKNYSVTRDYDGGIIRTIKLLTTQSSESYISVIVDFCGASSCSSVLEILRIQ